MGSVPSVSLIAGPEKCSLALVEDITERKREKEELRTRERQLSEAQQPGAPRKLGATGRRPR